MVLNIHRKEAILTKLAGRERLLRLYKAEAKFGSGAVPAELKDAILRAQAKVDRRNIRAFYGNKNPSRPRRIPGWWSKGDVKLR